MIHLRLFYGINFLFSCVLLTMYIMIIVTLPVVLLSFKIKLLFVTLHAAVLLLVVADDVDQPEVGAGEEQLVEVLRVDLRAPPPPPHGLDQGGHHAAGPLHLVVQVPRREQDPGLRAVQVITTFKYIKSFK